MQGGKIHISGILSSALAENFAQKRVKLNDIIHIIYITKNTGIK